MDISFLIVTRQRADDLIITLNKLKTLIGEDKKSEVLVYIDGCQETKPLIKEFDWVHWTFSDKSVSASPARAILYKKAKGTILVGLDDDAHPISKDFINQLKATFANNTKVGIIAFQEVRGLFNSDDTALEHSKKAVAYITNDFIGCGFAIKNKVYKQTNGFPSWINIYGEEPALALEVLNQGYQILYFSELKINHRIDVEARKKRGRNYFRFENQLRNTLRFYLVYYPNPFLKVIKTLVHNFKKYAIKDFRYFKSFLKILFSTLFSIFSILKYRKPVKRETIVKRNQLKPLKY